MSVRPVPARWFEVVVAQSEAAAALEALAATGTIELELNPQANALAPLTELRALFEAEADLAQRYAKYWPKPEIDVAFAAETEAVIGTPAERLERALGALRDWARDAEPLIARTQSIEGELAELATWRAILAQFAAQPAGRRIDFGRLRATPFALERRVLLFTAPRALLPAPPILALPFQLGEQAGLILLGPRAALDDYQPQAAAYHGRLFALPAVLEGDAARSLAAVEARGRALDAELADAQARLAELAGAHDLAHQRGEFARLAWFARAAPSLAASGQYVSIAGWTDDVDGKRVARALARAAAHAEIQFPPPPAGAEAPLVLRNPPWVRPFELFSAALGIPGRDEADPSRILAFIVPLLFGYMFGDLGQGLLLAAAGLLLLRRFAYAGLLIACGATSALFGLLFGSVFGIEHWIAALWVRPLEQPLEVLLPPLAFGALLLFTGLVLQALQAHWRAALDRWFFEQAGVALAYAGLLLGVLYLPLLWLCVVGVLWQLTGGWLVERRAAAVASAAAEFLEQFFQLAINTLSFVRVGAFALAHAGLSAAVSALAAGLSVPAAAIVIVLGNALVIAIEVLVVSVQTTRLVLFEFFVRFLRGTGRPFRPLERPPSFTPGRTP
jgi:V/A-type H+-transporting ATPase subunit I